MSDLAVQPKPVRKPGKLEAWRDEQARIRLAKLNGAEPPPSGPEELEAGLNFLMDSIWGRINQRIKLHSSPSTVYIFRAADGQALYVGVSMTALARICSHKNRCEGFWWETARISLEHFPDRRSALNRETKLIASLKPVHNIAKGTIK